MGSQRVRHKLVTEHAQAQARLLLRRGYMLVTHLTLRDSMNCSLPDSSIHGILQARILEWIAISFSKEGVRSKEKTIKYLDF